MPCTKLEASQLQDGQIGLLNLLAAAKLAGSNREARQLIQQGGIAIDGEKVTDPALRLTEEALKKGIIIKKGKKIYHKITL